MGPPQPTAVLNSSAKQVLRRLDNIDPKLKEFFMPATKAVMAQSDAEDALCRALAALSGLLEVPAPRRCKLFYTSFKRGCCISLIHHPFVPLTHCFFRRRSPHQGSLLNGVFALCLVLKATYYIPSHSSLSFVQGS